MLGLLAFGLLRKQMIFHLTTGSWLGVSWNQLSFPWINFGWTNCLEDYSCCNQLSLSSISVGRTEIFLLSIFWSFNSQPSIFYWNTFSANDFWVDAFKHDQLYCHNNNDCTSADITWMVGPQIDHNPLLFDINWYSSNQYCAAMNPDYYPKEDSQLNGNDCHSVNSVMCSMPCDDQSKSTNYPEPFNFKYLQ